MDPKIKSAAKAAVQPLLDPSAHALAQREALILNARRVRPAAHANQDARPTTDSEQKIQAEPEANTKTEIDAVTIALSLLNHPTYRALENADTKAFDQLTLVDSTLFEKAKEKKTDWPSQDTTEQGMLTSLRKSASTAFEARNAYIEQFVQSQNGDAAAVSEVRKLLDNSLYPLPAEAQAPDLPPVKKAARQK